MTMRCRMRQTVVLFPCGHGKIDEAKRGSLVKGDWTVNTLRCNSSFYREHSFVLTIVCMGHMAPLTVSCSIKCAKNFEAGEWSGWLRT
jgi:hypothetical protein